MKTAAIIGISGYARHHLFMALEQVLQGRLRLAAATVVNQAEEAFLCGRLRGLGCELFDRTADMWAKFAGRVDLCFIPTGIHLHAPMTLEALRAGANVLVEKPLATSVADGEEIMRQEQATGRFVAVGFQDLYPESTWALKRVLLEGGIGRLRSISFSGLWPRPAAYYRRNGWAGRLRHDGAQVLDSPVNNAFAHFLNLALFWAGPALADSARVQRVECELYRAQPIESFDTCCLRAHLAGEVELHAYATHSCQEERVPRLRLAGTRGSIDWVQESHYDIIERDGTRRHHALPGKIDTKLMMADAVVARITNPAAQICGTAIAFEHLRLIEAMHHASPIVDLPEAHVRRRRTPTGEWREIIGIEAAVDAAAERGQLWSETRVPWAQRVIPMPQPPAAGPLSAVGGTRATGNPS